MQVRLTVTFDEDHGGKEYKLTCTSRDILAWEKAGPNRAAASVVVMANFRLDELYALAFATMRRQGLWDGSEKELRDWAEIDLGHYTADVEDEPEHGESDDPTQSGHSTGE